MTMTLTIEKKEYNIGIHFLRLVNICYCLAFKNENKNHTDAEHTKKQSKWEKRKNKKIRALKGLTHKYQR